MLRNLVVLAIGILIGAAGVGGYFYTKWDSADTMLAAARREAASTGKALQARDEQLQKVTASLTAARGELKQAQTAKESAEVSSKQALQAKDEQLQKVGATLAAAQGELKQAQTARESAEASSKQALQDKDQQLQKAKAGLAAAQDELKHAETVRESADTSSKQARKQIWRQRKMSSSRPRRRKRRLKLH
jgi:chromosome segregation ATPase